ncbi:DinB family protein [Cryptosporangium phraense]|uniref:DinB family protein n=1 Tax=Cryptosporangium phraense TaxID=2593070 RepID=A0A545AMF1_9ACTN|nr:DinB family protein [Cryptosporangium phraense]TQS42487.1 DinB family protein [Cryptosporangium phraense]
MYAPAEHDEITGLLRYLVQQLDALRASAFGLTEAQSRETPCRSSLSIAGLIKHAAHGMRGAAARLRGTPSMDFDAYLASFAPAPDETTTALIAEFDAARAEYLEAFAAADPDAVTIEPPAPWHGRFTEQPVRWRYYLVHQIEEMARHAGHADIIREQLDGMSIPALVLTVEGAPANDFFQPYVPEPGTIGAP